MNLGDLHKVWEIKALKRKPNEEEARKILDRIAKQVQPIMRNHSWRVKVLSEFWSVQGRWNRVKGTHGSTVPHPAHHPQKLLLYYGEFGVKRMLSDEHVMFPGRCQFADVKFKVRVPDGSSSNPIKVVVSKVASQFHIE